MPFTKAAFWNESEARLRAGWRLAIQLTVNLGTAGLLLWALHLARTHTGLFHADSPWAAVVLVPGMAAVTLFSVWFAGRFLDRRRFSDFGVDLDRGAWWADFCFGLVVGVALPIGFAAIGMVTASVRFEPAFTSGFPGLPFGAAALLSATLYLCVGLLEEVGRAYQVRNILEGTAGAGLGLEGTAAVAVMGAAVISVLMHSGNLNFLLFVLLAAALKGTCYLLTGRAAIALAYHAAWDLTMATVLGFSPQDGSSAATVFYVMRFRDPAWASGASDSELTPAAMLILLVLELLALLLILGWVRLRYGEVKLRSDLLKPHLRE